MKRIVLRIVILIYNAALLNFFIINLHLLINLHLPISYTCMQCDIEKNGRNLSCISKILNDPQYSLIFHDIGYYSTFQAFSFLIVSNF